MGRAKCEDKSGGKTKLERAAAGGKGNIYGGL